MLYEVITRFAMENLHRAPVSVAGFRVAGLLSSVIPVRILMESGEHGLVTLVDASL